MKRLLLFVLLCLSSLLSRFAAADQVLLPRPPELEPDVQFWIRVYTEISTNEGFIHDQHKLSVVYETLHFDADTPPRERERTRRCRARAHPRHPAAPGARRRAARPMRSARCAHCGARRRTPARLAAGGRRRALPARPVGPLSRRPDARRAPGRRISARCWRNLGLPAEIAALPHVESSFDPYRVLEGRRRGAVAVHALDRPALPAYRLARSMSGSIRFARPRPPRSC